MYAPSRVEWRWCSRTDAPTVAVAVPVPVPVVEDVALDVLVPVVDPVWLPVPVALGAVVALLQPIQKTLETKPTALHTALPKIIKPRSPKQRSSCRILIA
jgi:hypothetical protein